MESSWSSTTLEHSGSPTLTLAARTHLCVEEQVAALVNLMNTQGGPASLLPLYHFANVHSRGHFLMGGEYAYISIHIVWIL